MRDTRVEREVEGLEATICLFSLNNFPNAVPVIGGLACSGAIGLLKV